MLQIEQLRPLLRLCHEAGIHTAVDTAGNVPWPSFEAIIPFTDLFLYDIKAMDSAVHRACTGAGNERILENFERLYGRGCDIRVRIPYIPGWNDGELDAIAAYLRRFPKVQAELLGYHELGNSKYRALGLEPIQAYSPTKNEIDALKARYGFI